MAVTGTARVSNEKEFKKTLGLGAFSVLGVNLDYPKLKELGFYVKDEDLEKERVFTGEKEGVATVRLEFAVQNLNNEDDRRKFSFFLENAPRVNKSGTLYSFINNQGRCAWSTNEDKYVGIKPEYDVYFTGLENCLEPRKALKGEEELMLFMRAIFANMDWRAGATLTYNTKKWFGENFDELNKDLKTDVVGTVIVGCTIKEKDGEDGKKYNESFYNKAFAPGSYYKFLNNKGEFTALDVDSINKRIANNKGKSGKDRNYVNPLEELVVKMADSEYGCTEIYHLGKLKEFNPEEHFATSSSSVVQEDSSEY
jgi:hypothetical protein